MGFPPEYNKCISAIVRLHGEDIEVMSSNTVGHHRKMTVKIKDKGKVAEFDCHYAESGEIIPALERSFAIHD